MGLTVEPMEAPTDADAPGVVGAQRPTDGEKAAVNRPLVARTAVKLPKFSRATQLEPYLAQFRLEQLTFPLYPLF